MGGAIFKDDNSTVLQHTVPELTDFIEKDEYVGDVLGSGGANLVGVTKFPFNPGQASLFPLGAAEAAKWTNWKCEYCEVYLLHEVSEFATDGSTGKVILAFDYNAANDTPTTKQQVEDMHSASAMGCEDVGLRLMPNLLNKADPKYVRTGVKPAGTDIRLYDGGNLFVVSAGQAGTTKISELRVRYRFRMFLPTLLNPTGGLSDDSTVAQFQSVAGGEANTAGSGMNQQLLLAGAQVGSALFVNTAGSIVPPAGDYQVTYSVQDVSTVAPGDLEGVTAIFQKNAATVALWNPAVAFVANTLTTVGVVGSVLVSANGTDAFTLLANITFTGGTQTMRGNLIFTLV